MGEESGSDWPTAGAVVEIIPASHPQTYLGWVEEDGESELTVSAPVDAELRPVSLSVGERLDVVWRSNDELLSVSAELAEVNPGERPRWRLRAAGVVRHGQRRDAVRVGLSTPIRLVSSARAVAGATIDLSEGGTRCVLERQRTSPVEPSTGEVVQVSVTLPEATVSCLAEVVRRHPREDARVELSLRFIGLSEPDQDKVRRHVFTRLRELRRRGLL